MFDEKQIDVLKELCNIGSGSAATVLSSFLRRDIRIEVPRIMVGSEVAELFSATRDWMFIDHAIGGGVGGKLVVCVREPDAEEIIRSLTGAVAPGWRNDETAISAVREVSNILTSYFLGVLGQYFGQVLVPGVPEVLADTQAVGRAVSEGHGLLVETTFRENGGRTAWYLLLLPEPAAMSAALDNLLNRKRR